MTAHDTSNADRTADMAVRIVTEAMHTKSDEPIQWVDDKSTILVTLWPSGRMEIATRPQAHYTWGPPTVVREIDPRTGEPKR